MVSKIIHKKIGVSAEYVKFCRRVFGDENLVEIYRNSAENNIFLAGLFKGGLGITVEGISTTYLSTNRFRGENWI